MFRVTVIEMAIGIESVLAVTAPPRSVRIAIEIAIATATTKTETGMEIEIAAATMDAGIIAMDMIDVATVITTNGAGGNMSGDTIVGHRDLICIPITIISTAQTLTTTVIAMDCPREQTMLAAAKVTIPSARIFSSTRAADSCRSLVIRPLTAPRIVMVFCVGMKKDSAIGSPIS